jgi:hypothetical protein
MIGEPDAGKPHVRFDEGVQETHGPPQRACALLHQSPHHGDDLFLLDLCGNRSAGVR